ncbi:MAG: hypothetical protein ACI4XP_03280 [Acutalibacteraceae bacterium]
MKKFSQAEKKINGVTYKAQFNGIMAALDAIDNSYIDGTNRTSTTKLAKYVLENVIIEPANMQIDDFEDMDTFQKVIAFGQEVMQGQFQPEKNEKSTGTKSKG